VTPRAGLPCPREHCGGSLLGEDLVCTLCARPFVSDIEQRKARQEEQSLAAILDAGGHLQGHRKGRRESA
jgi:hypothetical protein